MVIFYLGDRTGFPQSDVMNALFGPLLICLPHVRQHLPICPNPSVERVKTSNPTKGANLIPIWDHWGMKSVMCTQKTTYFTITVSILIHVWTQWMALFEKINMPLKLHYVASFMLRWMSQTQINQTEEIVRVFLWCSQYLLLNYKACHFLAGCLNETGRSDGCLGFGGDSSQI